MVTTLRAPFDLSEIEQAAIYYQHRTFIAAVHAHQIMEQTEGTDVRRWAMACNRLNQLVRLLIDADIAVGYAAPSLYLAYKNYNECPGLRDRILHTTCAALPHVDQAFARKRVEVKRYVRRTQWHAKDAVLPAI